jgi:hypothetical protein
MSYEDDCNEYYFGIPFKKRVSVEAVPAKTEPKFKVGDRVRVVKDGRGHGGSYHSVQIGETFTLVSFAGHSPHFWRTNGPNFYEHEIELAPTIAIGDRVKLKRHFGPHAVGDAGKVRELITRAGFVNAGVDMESGIYSMFPVEVLEVAADCAVRKEQPKFKAGDRINNGWGEHIIKCVKTQYGAPFEGDVYTGPLAYDYTDGGWDHETDLTLVTAADCLQDNVQQDAWHSCTHYTAPQPAIVARVLDGQPRPSNIPFVHADSGAALLEAERLAKNNPGQEFAVYQRVGARVASVEYKMKEVA